MWRFFKYSVYAVAAIIIIIIVRWHLAGNDTFHTAVLLNSAERAFYKIVDVEIAQGQSKISLKAATNFSWDTVCVLTPYNIKSVSDVKTLVNADVAGMSKSSFGKWWESEGGGKLVFIQNRKVIEIISMNKYEPVLPPGQSNCIGAANTFMIYDPSSSRMTLTAMEE